MQTLDIYRGSSLLVSIKPGTDSTQSKRLLGDNVISLRFTLSVYVDFMLNDYCLVFGERYTITQIPTVEKKGTYEYEYSMQMQHQGALLSLAQFLFLGNTNQLTETDFSLMGNAETFVRLILDNANRVSPGWTIGQVILTDYKNLTFSKQNCLQALSKIAEEFGTEFYITNKVINLSKKRRDTGYTFKHGRQKGLYEVIRNNSDDYSLITRLYVFGSEKNLPPNYNNSRLRLPGGYNPCLISNMTCSATDNGNGTQTIIFNWTAPQASGVTALQIEYRPTGSSGAWTNDTGNYLSPRTVTIPTGSYQFRFRTLGATCAGEVTPETTVNGSILSPVYIFAPIPYVEKNVSAYGVIEYTEIFEDIYPRRKGKVTSVNGADIYKFIDAGIDFDINQYLLPGTAVKVVFNTGQLAGYQFEVSAFNNSTKELTILKNKEERSLEIPSVTFRPAIGDEFVLVDVQMPQSYIAAAEAELLAKATELINRISVPQYKYSVSIDPLFMKSKGWTLDIGDEVWLDDKNLDILKKIRVVQVNRNIVNEFEYQVELADNVVKGTLSQIIGGISSQQGLVNGLSNQLQNTSILNNTVIGILKVSQGTIQFFDFPTTNTMVGFSDVVVEDATGKLHKKI